MTEILRIEALCKSFGGIVVADNIEMSIAAGEIVGLIGPNGAGKTTLFNLISGALAPDAGGVFLNGAPLNGLPLHRRARAGIARTWQNMRLFRSMSVLDNLLLGPREYGGERVLRVLFGGRQLRSEEDLHRKQAMAILERMGLAGSAQKSVAELPYGQQKLVGMARAMMNDGKCLLLDEPMAGVEGQAYEIMKKVVRDEAAAGRAVCIVEHNISFIKDLCTRAVFMSNGRIIQSGSVDELLASETLTELYFGT